MTQSTTTARSARSGRLVEIELGQRSDQRMLEMQAARSALLTLFSRPHVGLTPPTDAR